MKERVNFGYRRLFTDVLPPGVHQHEVERNLEIIRYLGGSTEGATPEVWFTDEDKLQADSFLSERGLTGGRRIVAFGVGASDGRQRWPFYGELLSLLTQTLEFTPLVLCGPREEHIAREIVAACPCAVPVERMPLRAVASMLSRCDLFVGNDSGPMHLAAAAGCPVVEISCHPVGGKQGHLNDPERFGPLGAPHLIIRPRRFAEGCDDGCRKRVPHCIATIAPEEVAAELVQFVESTGLHLTGSLCGLSG
jgi:heptosyltransferase-2